MKKATILERSNKIQVMDIFSFILKKNFWKKVWNFILKKKIKLKKKVEQWKCTKI